MEEAKQKDIFETKMKEREIGIAKKFLSLGVDIQTIIKATGLDEKEVKK
jgi:hypothetical protein